MGKPKEVEYEGITYPSGRKFCEELKINYETFKVRRRKGWTLAECVAGTQNNNIEEEKSAFNNIYNTKIVNSIDDLVDTINLFPNIEKINLIDYENVSDNRMLTENHLKDENMINIFFFNACIYSNNYYSLTRTSKSVNIQVISLEAADQLIDHLIVFYLGALVSRFPDKKYRLYSRDNGYNPFINTIKYPNITIAGLNKSVKRGHKYSLAKYILNHSEITESKYFGKNEFRRLFLDFYSNKKFNSHTSAVLINELLRYDFIEKIEMDDNKSYYRFCLKRISEYMEYINKKTD